MDIIVRNSLEFERVDQIDFKKLIVDVVAEKSKLGPVRILDVGGGQFPFLEPGEIPENAEYVVCDISVRLLEKCPDDYHNKFCLTFAGLFPGTSAPSISRFRKCWRNRLQAASVSIGIFSNCSNLAGSV